MYPSRETIRRISKWLYCPQCNEPKDGDCYFCNSCLEKIPYDIKSDLTSPEEYVRVAAFADATIYLTHDGGK